MKVLSDENVPDGAVAPAAYCDIDFNDVCSRLGLRPVDRYIVYGKKLRKPRKRYRCIGAILDNGRFASLIQVDGEDYFQIWLQRVGYGYRIDELDEVRKYIGVDIFDIVLLDNGLKWIRSDVSDLSFRKISMEWLERKARGRA